MNIPVTSFLSCCLKPGKTSSIIHFWLMCHGSPTLSFSNLSVHFSMWQLKTNTLLNCDLKILRKRKSLPSLINWWKIVIVFLSNDICVYWTCYQLYLLGHVLNCFKELRFPSVSRGTLCNTRQHYALWFSVHLFLLHSTDEIWGAKYSWKCVMYQK